MYPQTYSKTLSKLFFLFLLSLSLALASCSKSNQKEETRVQAPPAIQGPLVLEGATLISPEQKEPLPDSAIVVSGNRIQAVGKVGSVSYPEGAHILKLAGKYVIPGFIDSHVHLQEWSMELFLANGITSILEQSSTPWVYAVRDGVAAGKIRGPRIFVSNSRLHGGPQGYAGLGYIDLWGNGIAYDGITPEDLQEVRAMDTARGESYIDSPEKGREVVKKLLARHADAIKVHHNLDRETLKAIIEEAHRGGVPVVGHRLNAREIAELGMDFIEHTSPVAFATITDKEKLREIKEGKILDPHYLMDPAAFPAVIDALVKKNVYFNPTLSGGWRAANGRQKEYEKRVTEYFSQPGLKYVPPELVQKYMNDFDMLDRLTPEQAQRMRDGYKKVVLFMNGFVKAGGKLLAGSDPNNTGVPGLGIHQEMELMVDAGISPMEAFKSATIYEAQLMHKEKDLGTVEAGKLADLVVLGGNPLEKIENTQKVETVIIDGKIVDTSFHPDYKMSIPNPSELGDTRASNALDVANAKAGVRSSTPARLRLDDTVPNTASEGSQDFEIELRGKFLPSSQVIFNQTPITAVFENPRALKAKIPQNLLQRAGTYPIQVTSPMFGGGTDKSNQIFFIVEYRQAK